jgi:hypothetical protein
VHTTAFAVPPDSLKYWEDRLTEAGVSVERAEHNRRAFEDRDTLARRLALPD